jgi:glycosyltransferase involved in cell wall biosynthesis
MSIPTIENYQNQTPHPKRKEGGKKISTKYNYKSTIDKPLITIITIVRNSKIELEQTILSVISQTYDNIEYIIIDGNSSDGTQDLLYKYNDKITYWISEPDQGISDAFNKGIVYSSGTWINFLNAGDVFIDNSVLNLLLPYFLNEKELIVSAFSRSPNSKIPSGKRNNQQSLPIKATISHQASFVHKSIFQVNGLFDLDFDIRMDYEFWLRVLKQHSFIFLDKIIIDYNQYGISSQKPIKFCQEEIVANNRHLDNPIFVNFKALIKCIARLMGYQK